MWKKLPDLHFKIVNHQTININNIIYVIGGYKNSSSPSTEKISVYIMSKDNYCAELVSLQTFEWHCIDRSMKHLDVLVQPIDRYGHTVVTWRDMGILFGGSNDSGYCQSDVYLFVPKKKYDVVGVLDNICDDAERWVKVTGIGGSSPMRRDGHSAVVHGNSMFLYGGLVVDDGHYYDNKLFQLDLKGWQWSIVHHGEFVEPLGRDFCHLLAHNNSLFLLGGRSDNCFHGNSRSDVYDTALWNFDLKTRIWTKVHPGHGVVFETMMEDTEDNGDRHDVLMTICPQPRRSSMTAILKEDIILFGGLYESKDFCIHFNDVWSFNLFHNEWRCLSASSTNETSSPSPVPLRRGSLTKINGHSVLLMGGSTTHNGIKLYPTEIVGKSLSFPSNSKACDFNLVRGESVLSGISCIERQRVALYLKSNSSFKGSIETTSDINLRSTGQVFLLHPQLSLYQKALSIVVTMYSLQQLRCFHIPTKIISDAESIRIYQTDKPQ